MQLRFVILTMMAIFLTTFANAQNFVSDKYVLARCGEGVVKGLINQDDYRNGDGTLNLVFESQVLTIVCGLVFQPDSILKYKTVATIEKRYPINFWRSVKYEVGQRVTLYFKSISVPGTILELTDEGYAKVHFDSSELNLAFGKFYYGLWQIKIIEN